MINQLKDMINEQISIAFSDAQIVEGPVGFGWAQNNHFRMKVKCSLGLLNLVLKKSWSTEKFETERYMYTNILPHMSFPTSKYYGSFSIQHDNWILIEDIGNKTADGSDIGHRKIFLNMLGELHGKGINMLKSAEHNFLLPKFLEREDEAEKLRLLQLAERDPKLSLGNWAADLWNRVWSELNNSNKTIIHGDTDMSNVILNDKNNAGLIDFEKSQIGPASIDFSKLVDVIKSDEELDEYLRSFVKSSGNDLALQEVKRSCKLAEVYDKIHWICYDIANIEKPSYVSYKFDEQKYRGKVENLKRIAKEFY